MGMVWVHAGALIAAATDLSFNPRGYAAVLANDVLTSLYLIMVKNTPGTNGLRCGPACVAMCWLQREAALL